MAAEALIFALTAKSKNMITLLFGEDTYRLHQKIKRLLEAYRKKYGDALLIEQIDAKEVSFREFLNSLSQRPIFVSKKFFLIKNFFSNNNFKQEFLKRIQEFSSSDNDIVIYAEKDVAKTSEYKKIKTVGTSQHFGFLKGATLEKWVQTEAKEHGIEIKGEVLRILINSIGSDLWRLENEIQKLSAYENSGEGMKLVEVKDVRNLVVEKIETNIFKTIDALAEKNIRKGLSLLQQHLDKGDDPSQILNMVSYQFRTILLIKAKINSLKENWIISPAVLSKQLGLNVFVASKLLPLAKKFSLAELKKIHKTMFDVDLMVKTGKIKPEEGIKILVLGIKRSFNPSHTAKIF